MDAKKEDDSQYAKLGVDAGKSNVRSIFKSIIDNEYPDAFVNIITAPYTNGKIAMTQHQDGDGSKMIARLLYYLETGDDEQIGYAVDDAFTMNASDVSAAGFVRGTWVVTQVLNSGLPKELKEVIMISLANRWSKLKELYESNGFDQIYFLGGETADLRDQVRSAVFDMTITAYADKTHIIKGDVKPGNKIWGFASDGRAAWEEKDNSGIMANGLTLARSCLFWKGYDKKYPILKRDDPYYTGRLKVMDTPKLLSGSTISDAILSPTRQWPIIIRKIMDKLIDTDSLELLHGISINTGGGATKIKNIGRGIIYCKTMPKPAPIFQLIRNESKEKWEYMFETFNCGIGIDIIGEDDPYLKVVLNAVADECNIRLYDLGSCTASDKKENTVILKTAYGNFCY